MQMAANSPSRSSALTVDGERAAYRAHVAGRRIGYLDTDAWIRLGRDHDEVAERCRLLCESGGRRKRLIFPLSYAACSELVQQAPSPSRDARVHLMQSLSEGVAFRDRDTVRRIEAESVVPLVLGEHAAEADMSRLFAGVQECLSDLAGCDLVGTPLSQEILWRARHTNLFRSLAQYVHICDGLKKYEESRPFFEARREILSTSVTNAANAVRDPNGRVNRARALHQEAAGAFMNALPALRAAFEARPPEDQRRLAGLTPKAGEIGIFQLHESSDPDTGARVTVKRYSPTRTRTPDGEPHVGGALTPSNPAFKPIAITEGVDAYAKLIEVLKDPT
jgi:hypothetical protein